MSTNQQTNSAANLEQIGQVVESAVKSLKGKYDGRRFNGGRRVHRKAPSDNQAKPRWAKNLTNLRSKRALEEFDRIASPSQIYERALAKGLYALCWQMREDATNRLAGKPYVAENPAISKQSAALAHDNRLQVAIQNLVLTPGAKRTSAKGKKIKQLAAPPPTLDATTPDAGTDLDASTLP